MRRALALAVTAVVATGCSSDKRSFVEPLHLQSSGQILFRQAELPASRGPALGAEHLFFLDRRHGFAATTGGGGYIPHTGYGLPTEPGRIQVTGDGGRTWRTVWSRRNVVFQSISFAGRSTGLAVGSALDLRKYRGGGGPPSHTLLLKTSDGGRTWLAVHSRPVFGPHYFWPQYNDPTLPENAGFLLASSTTWYAFGRETRRSRDGGQTWVNVPVPRATTLLHFASSKVGYAAASAPGCSGQQLWKTIDAARSWFLLSGTCVGSYMSIDFLDERRGFTSAGPPPEDYSYKRPQLVIRATSDGGLSWETRYADRSRRVGRDGHWPTPTALHFMDERNGWAVSHEESQGATFEDLHVTRDGGRHWQRRLFPAWQLPTAFVAGGYAWVSGRRTADFGRTWRVSIRPREIEPYRLRVATRERVVVDSGAETLETHDRGAIWTTIPHLSDRATARAMGEFAFVYATEIDPRTDPDGPAPGYVTATGTRLHGPTKYWSSGALAFRDGRDGLAASGDAIFEDSGVPVYATDDAGRSWRRVRLPEGVADDSLVALGPDVIVIESGYPPPRGKDTIAISVDAGRHWSTIDVPRLDYDFWRCHVQRPSHASLWIACTPDSSTGGTLLIRSDDGGQSWRKLTGKLQLDPALIALDSKEAWAIGHGYGRAQGAHDTLWHTVDGGQSWQEFRPSVPPDSREYGLQRFFANPSST